MKGLPDLSQLTSEQKDALIYFLFEEVQKLMGQLAKQEARIAELEARLAKDSHNSNQPPSSDGLSKPARTVSLRERSGKKPGGQVGHPGKTLERVSHPDETILQPLPARCEECGTAFVPAHARVLARRQVFDIPEAHYQVIEYCTQEIRCGCGRVHTSAFPPEVQEAAQYGPRVRALGVHLTQGQLLPFARAAELISDLCHLEISPGTLVSWVGEASQRLEPTVASIAEAVREAPVVGADESGLRVGKKLHWLHTVVTPMHTWYGVHPKRGFDAIEAHGVLPGYAGTLVHDGWKSYWPLPATHALCNAHLLRELIFIGETTGRDWPPQMIEVLRLAGHACEQARENNLPMTEAAVEAIVTQYRAVLGQGQAAHPEVVRRKPGHRGRIKQSAAFNLLDRLQRYEAEVLRFLRDPAVPFTNNLAERAIRMPKVKQKISGTFRSLKGAQHFATIRSYLDTLRKQNHRMLGTLHSVFKGNIIQPAKD